MRVAPPNNGGQRRKWYAVFDLWQLIGAMMPEHDGITSSPDIVSQAVNDFFEGMQISTHPSNSQKLSIDISGIVAQSIQFDDVMNILFECFNVHDIWLTTDSSSWFVATLNEDTIRYPTFSQAFIAALTEYHKKSNIPMPNLEFVYANRWRADQYD